MKKTIRFCFNNGDVIAIDDPDDLIWGTITAQDFDWNKVLILNNPSDTTKRWVINLSELLYVNYG